MREFIKGLLPVRSVTFYCRDGKPYRAAKHCRLSMIVIELSRLLKLSHRD